MRIIMIPGFEDSLGLFPYCLNVVIESGKFHCIETRVSKCPKPKDACCGSLLSHLEEMQTLYIECSLTKFLYVISLN